MIARFVLTRGSKMSVYRPAGIQNADGSPGTPTWSLVKADVPCLFEPITAELAGKVFGATSRSEDRGFTAYPEDIRAGDGLLVTSGRNNGTRFLVNESLDYDYLSRNRHLELGCVKTTEVFP